MGFAPLGTEIPTPVAGGAAGFTLPAAYKKAGLLTEDGGFEWSMEADGDPIKFFQDGYEIPSGLSNVTLTVKLAQKDERVRSLVTGKTADANGYMTIDGGGTAVRYVIFTEEIYKNGAIRRRVAANAGIKSVKEDKSERGSVNGYEVVFTIATSPLLNNEHIGEWLLPPTSGAAPVVSAAAPASAAAGASVTITGSGFSGATGVKFGAVSATTFSAVSNTSVTATVPAGSAGSAPIVVTTPAGASNAFPYTRGA